MVEGRPPPLVLVVAPRARGVKVDPISVRMRGVESEPTVRLRRGVAPGNMGNLRVQGTAYVGGGVCRICGSRLGGGDAGGAKMLLRACSGSAMIATMVRAAGGRQWVACAASAVRAECARLMRCQRQSEGRTDLTSLTLQATMARRVRSSETFEKTNRARELWSTSRFGTSRFGCGPHCVDSVPSTRDQLKQKLSHLCRLRKACEHKSLLKSFWGHA